MQLIRYTTLGGTHVGVLGGSQVRPLPAVATIASLLSEPLDSIRERFASAGAPASPRGVQLLAPVDGRTEVWAAGVTYERSRDARITESQHAADVYDRVYAAARPELFFKSVAWRVAGPAGKISVRGDSEVNVPEPELAVVYNAYADPVGYTICNDVSSRSIEGDNPLYLPQAKVYAGSCAIGPGIRPAWEVPDPYGLAVAMTITREHEIAWQGESGTAALHRRLDELADYLFLEQDFPEGVVLSTGAGLVPDLPFTLEPGDAVRIEISGIGTLANTVVRGKDFL
jgi:2-dehydro-3-deoxy-D-arabinonate dehydratase